jgi:PEP-CTERM motif
MRKTMLRVLLVVAALGLYMMPAHADQIFVCQSCTAPPGGEPNIITDASAFNVGIAGSHTLQDPLLIIVAVYNGDGTPSIDFTGASTATVGTYGLTANTATFTTGTAFAALGLSAGGSESFSNLSDDDVENGFAAPTSFELYAFALPTSLSPSAPITIGVGAAAGSFILGYSCNQGTGSTTGCASNGDRAQTVDTNMGLLNGGPPISTPEPESLGLLGLGLLSLAVFTLRRPVANLS